MHTIQRDAQGSLDTVVVYYNGSDALLPGYAVCYDVAAPLTPAAGEFEENIRGRAVTKPATANLNHFAGVVTTAPQKRMGVANDNKGFCTIATLKAGTWANALVLKASTDTALTDIMTPVNAQFYLSPGGTTVANSVGIAGEVKTATSATTVLVMGLR